MTIDDFERWLDIAFKWWFRGVITLVTLETLWLVVIILRREL